MGQKSPQLPARFPQREIKVFFWAKVLVGMATQETSQKYEYISQEEYALWQKFKASKTRVEALHNWMEFNRKVESRPASRSQAIK